MTYVIAEPCVDHMDQSCVAVCPVDCISSEPGSDRKLHIDPDGCIECGSVLSAVRTTPSSRSADLPAKWPSYAWIDAAWFRDADAARDVLAEVLAEAQHDSFSRPLPECAAALRIAARVRAQPRLVSQRDAAGREDVTDTMATFLVVLDKPLTPFKPGQYVSVGVMRRRPGPASVLDASLTSGGGGSRVSYSSSALPEGSSVHATMATRGWRSLRVGPGHVACSCWMPRRIAAPCADRCRAQASHHSGNARGGGRVALIARPRS